MATRTTLLDVYEHMEKSRLIVRSDQCVSVRNRNVQCSQCIDVCDAQCITVSDNNLKVAYESCLACGACAAACPTGVFAVAEPPDDQICIQAKAAMEETGGHVVIACAPMLAAAEGLYDSTKVVQVGCLARIDESHIVSLAAAGAKRISLVYAHCDDCGIAAGMEALLRMCDSANELLEAWGNDVRATATGKLPGKVRRANQADFDEGRRHFFADAKESMTSFAVIAANQTVKDMLGAEDPDESPLAKVNEFGTLPQSFPAKRRVLIESLAKLGRPHDVVFETNLWARVTVDADSCTSCRMCTTFCPTGALFKFHTRKGKVGLKHRAVQCVSCGSCQAVCRQNALALSNAVSLQDLFEAGVSRYETKPFKGPERPSDSIVTAMKKLTKTDQVYS